jgi:hypothetical protein
LDVVFDILIVIVIAALIGFRLARAIAMDDVGRPIRDWTVKFKGRKPRSRPRTWLVGLMQCPHCIGVYVTIVVGLAVSAILLDVDWIVDLIIAAAAVGAQSLMATYAQEEQVHVDLE